MKAPCRIVRYAKSVGASDLGSSFVGWTGGSFVVDEEGAELDQVGQFAVFEVVGGVAEEGDDGSPESREDAERGRRGFDGVPLFNGELADRLTLFRIEGQGPAQQIGEGAVHWPPAGTQQQGHRETDVDL